MKTNKIFEQTILNEMENLQKNQQQKITFDEFLSKVDINVSPYMLVRLKAIFMTGEKKLLNEWILNVKFYLGKDDVIQVKKQTKTTKTKQTKK